MDDLQAGVPSDVAEKMKALERKDRELRHRPQRRLEATDTRALGELPGLTEQL